MCLGNIFNPPAPPAPPPPQPIAAPPPPAPAPPPPPAAPAPPPRPLDQGTATVQASSAVSRKKGESGQGANSSVNRGKLRAPINTSYSQPPGGINR